MKRPTRSTRLLENDRKEGKEMASHQTDGAAKGRTKGISRKTRHRRINIICIGEPISNDQERPRRQAPNLFHGVNAAAAAGCFRAALPGIGRGTTSGLRSIPRDRHAARTAWPAALRAVSVRPRPAAVTIWNSSVFQWRTLSNAPAPRPFRRRLRHFRLPQPMVNAAGRTAKARGGDQMPAHFILKAPPSCFIASPRP